MNIRYNLALGLGKLSIRVLRLFNRSGTALPGKIALSIDDSFLDNINRKCDKIILITGTNGKTTTNNLINHVLSEYNVLSNLKGANMRQGVASCYIKNTQEHYDYGVFEVDEGSLDFVGKYLKADYIILTNFFRDQLDRYGEIEGIINEVLSDIKSMPDTALIVNCDDPYINQFKKQLSNDIISFGLEVPSNHPDMILSLKNCPLCTGKLEYSKYFYGQLGNYRCLSCGFNNDDKDYTVSFIDQNDSSQTITINDSSDDYIINYPYIGLYNAYNVCGVFALSRQLNLDSDKTIKLMESFKFSLGRMEEFDYKNKKIKVILTKNPVGLSQAIYIISHDKRIKNILHILNDNPADGRDISWIWDANTCCDNEDKITSYYCSGIRAEDIALKKKYDDVDVEKINIIDDMYKSIDKAMDEDVEVTYVLPTYTAVFETRDYINKKVNR